MKFNLIKASLVTIFLLTSTQAYSVCEVTPEQGQNGGGYDDELVDISAYVSADSTIQCDNFSTVGAHTRVVSESTITNSTVGSNSRLKTSSAFGATIGASVIARTSSVRDSTVGNNVRLINSSVSNRSTVADGVTLKKSQIHSSAKIAGNARIVQSMVESASIGDDARIVRSNINYGSSIGEDDIIRAATIDGATIDANARVQEGAYIGGYGQQVGSYSVIGKDAQILQGGGFLEATPGLGKAQRSSAASISLTTGVLAKEPLFTSFIFLALFG